MKDMENRIANIGLHRFAVATACATFCLIVAGGLVTSTGSGLAVPDWPLSYGQVMPPMVGGIFYEHGHRMVATFVGFLTTILAVWLWRREDRRWVRWLGYAALVAVVVQGVLGGFTVLFLLPMPVSVAHAALAQSFFCLTVILALVTSPGWRSHVAQESLPLFRTRALALLATGGVLLQLILGAVMRHSEAGLAIPDFPLSYGRLIPPLSGTEIPGINEYRLQLDLSPVTLEQVWIHFAHRIGALIAAFAVAVFVVHLFRTYPRETRFREPGLLLCVLLIVQMLLGALTVWTGKPVETATAHVAVGALLLGTSVLLTVRSYHLYKVPEVSTVPGLVAEGSRP
jgi:cytochrome c oxidase assembly protein subunit 15